MSVGEGSYFDWPLELRREWDKYYQSVTARRLADGWVDKIHDHVGEEYED